MGIKDVSETFKSLSQEDRAALKELQHEETLRMKSKGRNDPVSLSEIIQAVTPGMPDPAYLS
jgi:hypothetical protein